jgi:protein ImuB
MKRFASIWFPHLTTDWQLRRQPELTGPFVLAAPDRGRAVVKAANLEAQRKGIDAGMVVADCRAILPSLLVLDDIPGQSDKLLNNIAGWCLRFSPVVAVDLPDGLILDISGCTHLWGGEEPYLSDLVARLKGFGYDVRAAVADTIGAAWAMSHYGQLSVVKPGAQAEALLSLPAAALRLDAGIVERLQKLGLNKIKNFMNMPRTALRRRFGQELLWRLNQALGQEVETLQPVCPVEPYQERLPSLEPIRTAKGIEIALQRLLEVLCLRLFQEGKGLRKAIFKGYRIDGNIQQIMIGTSRPSCSVEHLFRLFELRISTITPALGMELFVLEAPVVEDIPLEQDTLWAASGSNEDKKIAELLDRISGKVGAGTIHRYLPDEHYWPERSIKIAGSLQEKAKTGWRTDDVRPVHLLEHPESIEVTVPIPDYPPMLFRYHGTVHKVAKADGPERIEQEWWLDESEHRDYYCVEDEQGARYWLFRLGHYAAGEPKWFVHGFFA